MTETTEAQKKFERPPECTYEVGQFNDMGIWYVRRTTTEIVALATNRAKALEIERAFKNSANQEQLCGPSRLPAPDRTTQGTSER